MLKMTDNKDRKIRKIEMVPWCGCMSDHLWSYGFVTLPPVYTELSSIISSCQYFVKTVVRSGSCRINESTIT